MEDVDNPRLNSEGKRRWLKKTPSQVLARQRELYEDENKRANEIVEENPKFASSAPKSEQIPGLPLDFTDKMEEQKQKS